MKRSISKRAAINIEPALTRIQKLVTARLEDMAKSMAAYPAATQQAGIKSEVAKAIADINNTLTIEIRNVEKTLNTVTTTNTSQSTITNPFNNTPSGPASAAPGSQ